MKKTLSILLACILLLNLSTLTLLAADEEYTLHMWGWQDGEVREVGASLGFSLTECTIVDVNVTHSGIVSIAFGPTDPSVFLEATIENVALDYLSSMQLALLDIYDFSITTRQDGPNLVIDLEVVGEGLDYDSGPWGPNLVTSDLVTAVQGICGGSIFGRIIHVAPREEEPEPEPQPELYTVRVESNPAGIATFSGYGTGFADGEAYSVAITSFNPNYEFTGWVGAPNGNIPGADVELVANFEQVVFEDEETPEELTEPIRYAVTAVSVPTGIATFTGEGSFRSGDSYQVAVDAVMSGYVFVEWATVNEGVIDGADVEVVAIFREIPKEPQIPEEPEIIPEPDVILDEEPIPEDVDALPDTGGIPLIGFVLAGTGLMGSGFAIRKKK